MEHTTSEAPSSADPPGDELDRLLLVPALGLAALVVVLCMLVSFRVPLHGADLAVGGTFVACLVALGWR